MESLRMTTEIAALDNDVKSLILTGGGKITCQAW